MICLGKGKIPIKIHIVQQDDTLTFILTKYHLTKEKLAQYNPHIKSLNMLKNGMKLKIPSKLKPLKHPSNKNSLQENTEFLTSQVHRRPIGEMKYDQKLIISTIVTEQIGKQKLSTINGVCCHCYQPIY